jgi:molybdopterin-binding protein
MVSTTITVSERTREMIDKRRGIGESDDQVLRRLLELAEHLEPTTTDASARNVFQGTIQQSKNAAVESRLVNVKINDNLSIEAISERTGKCRVYIPPEDILISYEPIISSALNTMKGKVSDIQLHGDIAFLTASVGVPFLVQLSKRSIDALGIEVDKEVLLTFKASSVHIY